MSARLKFVAIFSLIGLFVSWCLLFGIDEVATLLPSLLSRYALWLAALLSTIAWSTVIAFSSADVTKIGPFRGCAVALLSYFTSILLLALYHAFGIEHSGQNMGGLFIIYSTGGLYFYGWLVVLAGIVTPWIVRMTAFPSEP